MPIIRNIVLGAVRRGANLEQLCQYAGIDSSLLDQGDALVSFEIGYHTWEAAVALTNDPFLGLHIGQETSATSIGAAGYLMESSPNLQTAFTNLAQFYKAFTAVYAYSTEVCQQEFRVYCEPISLWNELSPETARQSVEISMSASIHIIKLFTGKYTYPAQILLRSPQPADISEYVRIFRVVPHFNESCNAIVFRLSDMQQPVIGYNKELNRVFAQLLQEQILKSQSKKGFAEEVRKTILQHFLLTMPQLNEVAEQMNMSPRTLQRKLQEEGYTFQKVAESVRRELSLGLLRDQRLTVAEVAYKLGYTEPSAFQRAFRQWTGQTPKSFRASQPV